MVAAGLLDVVAGDPPVPVDIWRVTDINPTQHPEDGLTRLLAVLLLGVFTRPGDLVVDLTNDPTLAGVAGAGTRPYRPVHTLTELTDLTTPTAVTETHHRGTGLIAGQARLTFLRWPLPAQPATDPRTTPPEDTAGDATGTDAVTTVTAAQLFTACRRLAGQDGCTIVAIAPTPAQLPYIEHSQLVIPAAYRAGLGYLQHIIVVTAPAHPEPAHGPTDEPDEAMALVLNLLVFAPRAGRHG